MKIELNKVAKRYRMEWVLRQVTLSLEAPKQYAITGPNGSGKSTLMKILSGHLTPSKGKREYFNNDNILNANELYLYLSYCAPYIELIEELTLKEAIRFQAQFKPFLNQMKTKDILGLLGLEKAANKPIRYFSSGMKQRLKLALAICSDTPLLLLDEPTTNLDKQGVDWYLRLIEQFAEGRLLLIASNVEMDYAYCKERINIMDFKRNSIL